MDITLQDTALYLKELDNYLILTHRRPDGDTIGCAIALCLGLRRLGKRAYVLPNEGATALFAPYWGDTLAPEGFVPESVVAVDIASEGLFPQSAEPYRGKVALCIDHHPSNEGYAARTHLEGDKAACGEIIYALLQLLLFPQPEPPAFPFASPKALWEPVELLLPQDIALPLYLALSTDTGCFVYDNTSPNTHRIAGKLMETGIDTTQVNKRHFRTKSYTRLRIEGRIMEKLELHQQGTIALAAITLEDMAQLHAGEVDVEDIAAFPGQLEGVQTAVTIREMAPGECRLSVRTTAGLNASKVCALLGGGGHAQASGCTVKGSVADAKAAILKAIEQVQGEG